MYVKQPLQPSDTHFAYIWAWMGIGAIQLNLYVCGITFEDTKCVIRSCKLKDRQYNGQKKLDKILMIYKILHIKLKIPAPLVTPSM